MPTNPTKLVVTDGFHITSPLNVTYSKNYARYFTVVCIIEDAQLIIGFIMTAVLYFMGYTSGIIFLRLLSLVPIFYFLFLYYIKRKDFIRIQSV
jgi:ABC-type transport system involved in cytochrome bd biosynthesis fused ATPase/permease subunit